MGGCMAVVAGLLCGGVPETITAVVPLARHTPPPPPTMQALSFTARAPAVARRAAPARAAAAAPRAALRATAPAVRRAAALAPLRPVTVTLPSFVVEAAKKSVGEQAWAAMRAGRGAGRARARGACVAASRPPLPTALLLHHF